MKNLKIILVPILFLFINFVSAQKQKFSMSDAVNGLRSNLAIKNIAQPAWITDTNNTYFVQFVNNAYVAKEVETNKIDTLITLKNLKTENTLKKLPKINFIDSKNAYYFADNSFVKIENTGNNWTVKNKISVVEDSENQEYIPSENAVIYTLKNNLYYNKNGNTTAITNDANENIINGQAVHRNEFGIDGGIFSSPNHQKIAFYRMDQTRVEDYPIIDWSASPAKNINIKYPMAGKKSHEVSLGIYDVKSDTKIFLNIEGDKEQYLTAISWSPDSNFIFVGVLNRAQNHLKFNLYNAKTGLFIKTIFEEKSSKYVEPQNPISFLPNSNTDFIWQSQRSGYNHLYHYHTEKGLIAQITQGNWLVNSILGYNEKKQELFFSANKETPLEKHLYKVHWKSKKITRLDNAPGIHNGILSKNGDYLYDSYTNENTPRKINLINTNTLASNTILEAENTLKNFDRPEVKNISLKAKNGTPLYGKLILPTHFDASKKYPVIVYLYNGPHLQLITNTFPASGNLWYEYMAQNGYIIFTMDGRGSSNRGLDFEQAVFRNLGTLEMEDQMQGVDYLKSLPYVDATKLGVHGWSFGGFMTTNLMLQYPDTFKVGVAGGPVIDWNWYEIMYTERYMDTPKENPEGYANANLLNKVQNLKGKLLMIHGAQDNVVVWQHSVNFLKKAVDKDIQIDYFVYPGHEHNVIGKDRVHLMQKITNYFDDYLKK